VTPRGETGHVTCFYESENCFTLGRAMAQILTTNGTYSYFDSE